MPLIYSSRNGSAFATKLEVSGATYRAFFKQGEWNSIVRAGLHASGIFFVATYLPMRFTKYAKTALGYHGKSQAPLVNHGRLREGLLSSAYPVARATGSVVSLTISLPVPMMTSGKKEIFGRIKHAFAPSADRNYYANPKVAQVLKTITDVELDKMSEIMAATIQGLISGSETSTNRNGRTSMALNETQRSSIAHTVKSKQSLSSLHASSHAIH